MKKLILILIVSPFCLFAQLGGVKGNITSEKQAIPGVNVLVVNTNYGGISEANGNYRIQSLPIGGITLRFSAVGYKTKFVDVTIIENRMRELKVELEIEVIEVDEVRIYDTQVQQQNDPRTSLIDLRPESARTLPGAVTDVFRTLQSLPGILAPNDFSSQLVIRGSGPDQNLVIMDDIEVFNPYRLYGVISMFNPEAVSEVKLITGGFPANYGDRLSAVLDVRNKQGTRSSYLKGNINASIVSANVVLEGKNPFNIPGSWLVNSRRTYYDLIIEPFVKNSGLVDENVTFPNFYDVQTKLSFGPFNGHKILLNGIYSRDAVDLVSGAERNTPDSIAVLDQTKNDLIGFAWHYAPTKNFLNKFIVSWYRTSGDSRLDSEFLDPSLNRDDFQDFAPDTLSRYLVGFGFKSDYIYRKYAFDDKMYLLWDDKHELEAGFGFDLMRTNLKLDFDIDPQLQSLLEINPNIRAVLKDIDDIRDYSRYRLFVNNKFAITEKLFIQPGLRFDRYNILEKSYLAPRVSIAYALSDLTTIRAVWGNYYQSPGYEKLRDANILYDLRQEITSQLNAEKSTHYVFSFEHWLSPGWKAKIEGYYKEFSDLIFQRIDKGIKYVTERVPGRDPKFVNGWTRPIPTAADSLTQIPVNNSSGEAYGLELFLEKRKLSSEEKLSGWISYALAYTERDEFGLTLPFRFDQRHTFNLIFNYDINHWLEFGLRFQYGSGFPFTAAKGIKPRIILQDQNADLIPETPVIVSRTNSNGDEEVVYDIDFGDRTNRFQTRKPEYHRLDIRINALADWWGFEWKIYLDVINVYNRSNVINYDYYIGDDLTLNREATTMFPILPTIGFNMRF